MTFTTTLALSRSGRGLVHDTQAVHRTLKYLDEHVLWGLPDAGTLVVQHDKPIMWPEALPGVVTHSHTVENTPHTGMVDFAIIANPTYAEFIRGQRGKKRPAPPEKWMEWIHRRLDPVMRIEKVEATRLSTVHGKRHEMRTTHCRVLFTGSGEVTDHEGLHTLRTHGVGQGKAYGCGLLITQEVTK